MTPPIVDDNTHTYTHPTQDRVVKYCVHKKNNTAQSMSQVIIISFPNTCGFDHVTVFETDVVGSSTERRVREASENIKTILNEHGMASYRLPISYQDLRIAQKHGRAVKPRWERLYSVLPAQNNGATRLANTVAAKFMKLVTLGKDTGVVVVETSGDNDAFAFLHHFGCTTTATSPGYTASFPSYWRFVTEEIAASVITTTTTTTANPNPNPNPNPTQTHVFIGSVFKIPTIITPRLLKDHLGDPSVIHLKVFFRGGSSSGGTSGGDGGSMTTTIHPPLFPVGPIIIPPSSFCSPSPITLRDDNRQIPVYEAVMNTLFGRRRKSHSSRMGGEEVEEDSDGGGNAGNGGNDEDNDDDNDKSLRSSFGIRRACFQLPPNCGKTMIALRIAFEAMFALRYVNHILILTHTTKLGKQWMKHIDEIFTPLIPNRVIRHQVFQVMLFQAFRGDHPKPPYTQSMDEHNMRTLVIVDEVHHMPAKTFRNVFNKSLPAHVFPYIFGMTATMKRKDGHDPCINIMLGDPCYTMETIELGRNLFRFLNYHIVFPLPHPTATFMHEEEENMENDDDESHVRGDMIMGDDDPMTTYSCATSISENSHQSRLRIHRTSDIRARWMVHCCVIRDLIRKHGHKHIAILLLSINQVRLIIEAAHNLLKGEEGKTRELLCPCINEIETHVGHKDASSLRKLADAYNADISHRENSGGEWGNKKLHGAKLSIGTMQLIGEGFHDDTIDCIVFADPPPDMVQNGNRLRKSDVGTLVYLTSYGLMGGKKRADEDIKALRGKLFSTIKHDMVVTQDSEQIPATAIEDNDDPPLINCETDKGYVTTRQFR